MKVDVKDYKSLCELGLNGDVLSIECDYRRENSSFKDENHFFKNAENIRLICSDIESKKAEHDALLTQLSILNKAHIFEKRASSLIDSLRDLSKKRILLNDEQFLALLTPNFSTEFNDGLSFKSLETLLYGESDISLDAIGELTTYLKSLNETKLPFLVKLPIVIVSLIEANIDLTTIVVFISLYLNKNYSTLGNRTLLSFIKGKRFKTIISEFHLKKNMGDLMIVVREFLKELNRNYSNCCVSLRRKCVLLNSYKRITNNLEFDNAYLSILVFKDKEPAARDILNITTIPRRTVYRLINSVKLSIE